VVKKGTGSINGQLHHRRQEAALVGGVGGGPSAARKEAMTEKSFAVFRVVRRTSIAAGQGRCLECSFFAQEKFCWRSLEFLEDE
jgi:hypothetical protein